MQNKLYLIHPENAEAGAMETLPKTKGMVLINEAKILTKEIEFQTDDKICIISEASLDKVREKLKNDSKGKAIDFLKDKYKFRKILVELYPGYQYKKIEFNDIYSLQLTKKTVLKPLKGCFGTAVKIVDENSDLKIVAKEIQKEIQKNGSVLSENVLSKNDFILEEYIEGEEYAVDMFYDKKGEPHIVNIYHHPMPKIESYLHMIYYTGKDVFDKIYDKAIIFFKRLNKILGVKNFILHSEFKYDRDLFPIEINPMRYGGMGLGNMIYYSTGVNPYEYFIKGKTPDWKSIWERNSKDLFTFFIAYNGTGIDKSYYQPDIEKLKKNFTELLYEEIFDYRKQLAFGIFFIKENHQSLKELLKIDFNDYFKPIF